MRQEMQEGTRQEMQQTVKGGDQRRSGTQAVMGALLAVVGMLAAAHPGPDVADAQRGGAAARSRGAHAHHLDRCSGRGVLHAAGAGGDAMKKRRSGAREPIALNGDKRYVGRDAKGRFVESDDVRRSLRADRRRQAKTRVTSGYGDRGDRRR